MRNNLFRIILILNIIIFSSATFSLQGAHNHDVFTDSVATIFKEFDMTGLGIAIVKDDSIIYQNSFGYRIYPEHGDKGEVLQNDDLFRIASISKTFIASVILQLQEEGKLTLDDDAQDYMVFPLRNPHYPDRSITIKQLLTHTSGINDSRSWYSIDLINPKVDSLYARCYDNFPPGENYKYCNLNYTILGAVIEGVTRNKFYEEVDRRIMKPLSLYGGFNCNTLDDSKFVKLYRFKPDKGGYVEDDEAYRPYKGIVDNPRYTLGRSLGLAYPPSGMKISTGDLARYMMMHMYGGTLNGIRIISEENENAMRKNYVGKHNYGLSYRQYKDLHPQRHTLYGQTGGGHGLKSCMIFDPEEKTGFVIISSGSKSKYIDGYGDIHKPLIHLAYKLLPELANQR